MGDGLEGGSSRGHLETKLSDGHIPLPKMEGCGLAAALSPLPTARGEPPPASQVRAAMPTRPPNHPPTHSAVSAHKKNAHTSRVSAARPTTSHLSRRPLSHYMTCCSQPTWLTAFTTKGGGGEARAGGDGGV